MKNGGTRNDIPIKEHAHGGRDKTQAASRSGLLSYL